jgi:hypothetical protein
LLNRDTDFNYDSNWDEHPSYASLQEISEFSLIFKNTQGVCDVKTISWIGGNGLTQDQIEQMGFGDVGDPRNITVSITKMSSVAEEMFLTTDTQSDNIDTTYGQITFKNVAPLLSLNGGLNHYVYALQFDTIPNICPFEPDVWYKITVKYDQPMITLVYDYTNPLLVATSVERANVANSYINKNVFLHQFSFETPTLEGVLSEDGDTFSALEMRKGVKAMIQDNYVQSLGQVVPLNIDCETFNPMKPQMRTSFTMSKPNFYQFENLPSWEYCQRFDIKGVLCLYEGGFLRISGSKPSVFDEIVSKMKQPHGGGRADLNEDNGATGTTGATGATGPFNNPTSKTPWYQVAETQMNGSSVSINHNGTIIAIGSPNENCVRVYMQMNKGWDQRGNTITLENQNDTSDEFFGTAIALNSDGSQIAIGSPGSGRVNIYMYLITENAWVQYGTLPNESDGIQNTYTFGASISLDTTGNRIIVGAPNAVKRNGGGSEDQMMDTVSGSAYIYEYGGEPGYWILMHVIEDEFRWGRTGYSVSMNDDGNLVAVGSPNSFNTDPDSEKGGEPGCGSVRIFAYNNENWSQFGVVRGQNQFGQSVSIVGIPGAHIVGSTAQDRLCAYNNVDGTSDYSTMFDNWLSTSLKNTTVHISRAGDHIAYGYNDCAQKVLVYETGTYKSYTITDIAPDDLLSHMDVRISQQGNRIVVGAPFLNSNKGMVYVYENIEKPIGNIPELNGTEPFEHNDLILDSQKPSISVSRAIFRVGSTATIQIHSGIINTVDIYINNDWMRLTTKSEDDGGMYYTLSEYTDTGYILSIYNISVYDIIVKLNENVQISKVFRHYNLNGMEQTSNPTTINWKKVSLSVNSNANARKFQQVVNLCMKQHNIGSQEQLTDYQMRVLELQSQINVSAGDIIYDGKTVMVQIRSGTVKTVDISINHNWIRIYTANKTENGMYYSLSDYTDTGCMLYIYNVYVSDLVLRINENLQMTTVIMQNRLPIYTHN